MANQEQLEILLSGAENWNRWRKKNLREPANLQNADLQGAILQGACLVNANLQGADLQGANLQGANLHEAKLQGANLQDANLSAANVASAMLQQAKLQNANLANLKAEEFVSHNTLLKEGPRFENAFLNNANLQKADLQYALFTNADIRGADLRFSNFDHADVTGIQYDDKGKYRFIILGNCYGSQRFRRHAMDRDYIEEFQEKHPKTAWFWKWTSNYGRSLWLWALWSLGLAAFFGTVYLLAAQSWVPAWLHDWLPQMHYANGAPSQNWFTPFYFSIVTFTTLGFGDVTPVNLAGQVWLTLEVILGYFILGGLVSILANKMVRLSG